MPRRSRGVSIFTALPRDIKQTLRANPGVANAVSPPRTPNAADLLPTQPPSERDGQGEAEGDEDDSEWEEVHGDEASGCLGVNKSAASQDGGVTDEVPPPAARQDNDMNSSTTSDSQVAASAAAAVVTNALSSLKRAAEDDPLVPVKKRRGEETEGAHPWDCTGLVPRYDSADSVPGHLKKYFYQRHLLFPAYSRLPLLLDDIGWFSVTPASIAEHLAERCRCDVIVDAFCGVGGNAIAFARTCERVIAMDIDPTRLRLARHNALHYGVAHRIEFVLADYVAWAREYARSGAAQREAVDVVFLSPPWGGPEYLTFGDGVPTYPLSAIEPIPGGELFALTAAITPNVAYFLPRNVDVDEVAALAAPLPGDGEKDGGIAGDEPRGREWVEIEEQWVGDKLKANVAYFGGLVQ